MSSFVRSARSEPRPHVVRLAAALLCVVVALYSLGIAVAPYGSSTLALPALLFLLAAGSFLALVSAAAISVTAGRIDSAFRACALGLGTFAFTHGWLWWTWRSADHTRYLWIIRQGAPCSAMGGGPGSLWLLVMSVVFGGGAIAYAVSAHPTRGTVSAGIVLGILLTIGTALAMFPAPETYARIVGCF